MATLFQELTAQLGVGEIHLSRARKKPEEEEYLTARASGKHSWETWNSATLKER